MPGFNRIGPRGLGPMTGGRRGLCNSGAIGPVRGMGRGFGRGFGVGWGPVYQANYPYTPQMSREQEIDFLQSQAQALKEQMEQIGARISNLERKEN